MSEYPEYQTDYAGRLIGIDEDGNRTLTDPVDREGYYLHDHQNSTMGDEVNRVFRYGDPGRGVAVGITSYPDKLIPGLKCPDCACSACETDQVGIALCTGTPGWYFYYRQVTDGYGKPKTKLQQVGEEYVEVPEFEITKVERQPDGNFKEKKEEGEE